MSRKAKKKAHVRKPAFPDLLHKPIKTEYYGKQQYYAAVYADRIVIYECKSDHWYAQPAIPVQTKEAKWTKDGRLKVRDHRHGARHLTKGESSWRLV